MSRYFVRPADCPRHDLSPGVAIHTMAGRQMMMSVVDFEPNAVVERHSHPHEQIGILLSGQLDFTIGDEQSMLATGAMWRIPGGTPHCVVAGPAGARAIDIFHPVREDYQ